MNDAAFAALLRLNSMPQRELTGALTNCCGASRWVQFLLNKFPVADRAALDAAAHDAFSSLRDSDWLEAFAHHPKIGDLKSLEKKFAATAGWASGEQAGAASASKETLEKLATGNVAYLEKFGFIFIVCASGKSAAEMLALLEARMPNRREKELAIAAGEQRKITALRIQKLLRELA